jgi:hypothetical protein
MEGCGGVLLSKEEDEDGGGLEMGKDLGMNRSVRRGMEMEN